MKSLIILSKYFPRICVCAGVTTAGNVTEAPGVAKTTSDEISAFIISIKITNRIYDNSLEDNESQSYKILRQDVENVVRCFTVLHQRLRRHE